MTTQTPGPTPDTGSGPASPDFFDRIRGFGLVRPTHGGWVAGVASGVSRRTGLDVVLVRGLLVALSILGGLGFLLYGLGWLLLPQEEDGRIHLQEAFRGHVSAGLVGGIVATLAGLGGVGPWADHGNLWGPPPGLILLALIAGVVWWLLQRNRSPRTPSGSPATYGSPRPPAYTPGPTYPGSYGAATPTVYGTPAPTPYGTTSPTSYTPTPSAWGVPGPGGSTDVGGSTAMGAPAATTGPVMRVPTPPRRWDLARPSHRWTLGVLGLAVITAGILLLGEVAGDWTSMPALVVGSGALIVVGLGVVGAGQRGRRSGFLVPVGVVLALFVAGAAADRPDTFDGVGERTWAPTNVAAASGGYRLFAGDVTLDLGAPGLTSGATAAAPAEIDADLALGSMTIIVPDGVATQVDVSLGAGQIVSPNGDVFRSGDASRDWDHGQSITVGPTGAPVLHVDAQVGLGELRIETSPPAQSSTTTSTTTVTLPEGTLR